MINGGGLGGVEGDPWDLINPERNAGAGTSSSSSSGPNNSSGGPNTSSSEAEVEDIDTLVEKARQRQGWTFDFAPMKHYMPSFDYETTNLKPLLHHASCSQKKEKIAF